MDDLLAIWPNLIRNPEKTLKNAKGNLSDVAINVLIAGLVISVLDFYIGTKVSHWLFSAYEGQPIQLQAMALITIILGSSTFFIFSFLAASLVYYILSKLLGGTGTLTETLHKCSLVFTLRPATFILSSLFGSFWFPVVIVLLSLYMIYLYILAVKSTHSFGIFEAIVAVMTPTVIALSLPNLFGHDQFQAYPPLLLIWSALTALLGFP